MKTDLLVSIVVPIYNVEKYIEKCLSSIVNQTYKKIEIILVDDGSTDNSYNLCADFQKNDNRVKIIKKMNGGVSSARNVGIDNANGDYITFVDADDILDLKFVEYMVGLICKFNSDFCFSKCCYISKNENQNVEKIDVISNEMATSLLLSQNVVVGCWNKIYSMDLLKKEKIRFNEKSFYGEGLQFITNVAQKANRICLTNMKFYYYRKNNNDSATTAFNIKKYVNGLESLDYIKKNLYLTNKSVLEQLDVHYCLFYFNAISDLCLNNKKTKYIELYDEWINEFNFYAKKVFLYKSISKKEKIKILLMKYFPTIMIKRIKSKQKKIYNNSI